MSVFIHRVWERNLEEDGEDNILGREVIYGGSSLHRQEVMNSSVHAWLTLKGEKIRGKEKMMKSN